MADLPISGLTASASNAAATDVLPVVQTTGTGPVKMTVQQMAGGLLGSTTISGATVTTSQPVLNLAQTWNNAAVTFTGLKFNVPTDTSASTSLLMDLQVGAASKFQIAKTGNLIINSAGSSASISLTGSGTALRGIEYFLNGFGIRNGGTEWVVGFGSVNVTGVSGVTVRSVDSLAFSSSASDVYGSIADTILSRRAAANLRLGAADAASGVQAQTLSVQSITGTNVSAVAYPFKITGAQGTGTGAGGSIIFQVAPLGLTGAAQNTLVDAWSISGAGHFLAGTDNTYDIGASGATRPRDIYLGGKIVTASVQAVSLGNGVVFRNNVATGVAQIDANGSVNACYATTLPAGGTAGRGLTFSSNITNMGVFFGSGAPTLSAAKGSLYLRSDGSTINDRMYVNTDGSTTWTPVTTTA